MPAMAPFGIDGRELAVLTVLAAGVPLSQQEAADQLRVDRTTMVSLVDALEAKGLVERRRSTDDRRKNIVQLTETGRHRLRGAARGPRRGRPRVPRTARRRARSRVHPRAADPRARGLAVREPGDDLAVQQPLVLGYRAAVLGCKASRDRDRSREHLVRGG